MNQLGFKKKIKIKNARIKELEAQLEAAGGDESGPGQVEALQAENAALKEQLGTIAGELRAAKMREGRLKKQIEKIKK